MATDIDTWAIKEKIVAILKTNATLFSATGASGKVRQINAGAPNLNDIKNESILPIIYVTNAENFDSIKYNGIVKSNAIKFVRHVINLSIILLVEGKDGPKAEESADDFVKLIHETIEADYDLTGVGSASVDSCRITSHIILDSSMIGDEKQGRLINLECKIHSN